MVHVIATIEVRPSTRDAFLAEFHKLVPKVVAEEGCIDYGPTVDAASDIARQIACRDNVVTILERWESLAAPHMAAYREAVKPYVAGVQLQILEPA